MELPSPLKVRASILPQTPTMQEEGLPAYAMVNWWGFFGPAGMSAATVDTFSRVIDEELERTNPAASVSKIASR